MELPKRKIIRLKEYDYSKNGGYFITICTDQRNCLFGNVGEGFPLPQVQLNQTGKLIEQYIQKIPNKYPTVKIDHSVVMPNHIHLIIMIDKNEKHGTGNPSPTIGNIVGWFKYQTTKKNNELKQIEGGKLWQRSYYDHVIRNLEEYQKIWTYIDTNPLKWKLDQYHRENQ